VIGDEAPNAMKQKEFKNYFSRTVAIDASMALYQFLIAIRNDGQQMTNEAGDITSHLIGIFHRTVRMLEAGIKPVYVFDGKPPSMKSGELKKRKEARQNAEKELVEAKETGDQEVIDKFSRRLVKVLPEHNEEAKKLLKLMGIPVLTAPCEAEAQATELVKAGKVFAVASEDMDCLTFDCPMLLRNLTKPESKKLPVLEYQAPVLLKELGFTREQFVDMCILLGCDYCDKIQGIGPKKAVELIGKYKNIEKILKNIDTERYKVPENWPYAEARKLFFEPDVDDCKDIELKWRDPDFDGLHQFLVKEKAFAEDRVKSVYDRIVKTRKKGTQGRIDSFFKTTSVSKTGLKAGIKKSDKGKKGKKEVGKKSVGKKEVGKKEVGKKEVAKKSDQTKRKSEKMESKKPAAKKLKSEDKENKEVLVSE